MKVQLTQKATQWLRDCLAGPAWKKNDNPEKAARDAYKANQLLFEVVPETDEQPEEPLPAKSQLPEDVHAAAVALRAYLRAIRVWNDKILPEWEVDDKNLLRIQRCLKFFISQGVISSSKYTQELLKTFKVGDLAIDGD